jgi:3-dehydroquinate dehydratase/shikimate dehydrogenase
MPLICETVTAPTLAELRRRRDDARDADLVELRLDGVEDVDVAGALAGRRRPVVVTCRRLDDGGAWDGDEADRLTLLGEAVRLGAEYVDVEARVDNARLPRGERTRMILSHHDFVGVATVLPARVRAMRQRAPDALLKIAAMTPTVGSAVRLRDATADAGDRLVVGMGPGGLLTRVRPQLFGSAWTYAGSAAPGQVATRELVDTYRLRDVSAAATLLALGGMPLGHSASPAIHNAALGANGCDAVYVPVEAASAAEFLEAANRFGIAGASITTPLKTGWEGLGVRLDPVAATVGAINTLVRRGDEWVACNFDVDACLAPLISRGIDVRGQRVTILGAGGAARAAAFALSRAGARVVVSARRPDRARTIAEAFDVAASSWPPAPGWDVLVNATTVGMWPADDESPLAHEMLEGGTVYDLVYNPAETLLLRAARARGLQTIGGGEMLLAQAARQFEWWMARPAPAGVVAGGPIQVSPSVSVIAPANSAFSARKP